MVGWLGARSPSRAFPCSGPVAAIRRISRLRPSSTCYSMINVQQSITQLSSRCQRRSDKGQREIELKMRERVNETREKQGDSAKQQRRKGKYRAKSEQGRERRISRPLLLPGPPVLSLRLGHSIHSTSSLSIASSGSNSALTGRGATRALAKRVEYSEDEEADRAGKEEAKGTEMGKEERGNEGD